VRSGKEEKEMTMAAVRQTGNEATDGIPFLGSTIRGPWPASSAGRPANERTAEKEDEDRTAVDVAVVKVGEKGEHPPTNTTGPPHLMSDAATDKAMVLIASAWGKMRSL